MVFTNPVFKDEALSEYYTYLDTGQGEIVANESLFYREIFSKGLRMIEKIQNNGLILDIGCSTGELLRKIDNRLKYKKNKVIRIV